jgi:creatinine amidohydrolase
VDFLPSSTSTEAAERQASVAVLPIGSFEQHGSHLPLATDTIVACAIAEAVATRYELMLLPPITIACSHEHSDFPGTVSISATTLHQVIRDLQTSLEQQGIRRLVLVNGHGGNYVLGNVVQEANVGERRIALLPHRDDWTHARKAGGLVTDNHEDMHGGELETSILLHVAPELVRPGYEDADFVVPDRPHLHIVGMAGSAEAGIIGRPSLADAEKGRLALEDLAASAAAHLDKFSEIH